MNGTTLRPAVERALMRFGLTENMAAYLAAESLGEQPDEWSRIADRARLGQVTSVYLFVAHIDNRHLSTFVYAPGDEDHRDEILRLMGTRNASGWPDSPEGIEREQAGAYPVAVYDIGADVRAAYSSPVDAE